MIDRIALRALIGTACAGLILISTSCNDNTKGRGKLNVGGHDTPIIIQGGSLWIWTPNNFAGGSNTHNLSVYTATALRSVFQADNPAFNNAVQVMTLPTSWVLCTGNPQNAQFVPDGQSQYLNIASFTGSGSLVFAQDFGNNTSGDSYAFGRLHVSMAGFGGLYFGAGGTACPSIITATTPCPGTTPAAPCMIAAPNQPTFVALTH